MLNALIATSDTAEIDKFFGTFIQKLTNVESPDGMFKLSTFNGMVAFLKRMVMKKYKVEKWVYVPKSKPSFLFLAYRNQLERFKILPRRMSKKDCRN